MLWAIARGYGLCDADAGDVVQTVWLRLVERLDGLRDPSAVGGWLATTARRESTRLAARRGRDLPPSVAPPAAEPGPPPDQVVVARERVGQVAAALSALPRRCQTLLRLVAQAACHAELAAALRIPVGSVGPTRARCLATLRRLVG
ncbi:sigma-70 family RNA polymerase sigma factor [Actinomadura graeca]|uniref:Sigma-70 family RNA polymerase sigma factor n=2 Tax=Actinomadura graeca TaxID=2750812 RepID=A0ABX8R5M0_9ACTN|nr:sigma-70 family RNA polymerase sigma factor [Actinomadura graeca]